MGKNSDYMTEYRISSIFRCVLALCLVLSNQNAYGDCSDKSMALYIADEFGYMIVDENKKSIDIFKTILSDNVTVNIASCKIKETTGSYFIISSRQPVSYKDIDIHVSKQYSQSPDSIFVRIKLPPQEADGLNIKVMTSAGRQEIYSFSSDGIVEFSLKKQDFKYDNYFSVIIFPEIYPFGEASSWGDSETLSFLDLRLDDIWDVTDPEISMLDIDIPDFTNAIFQKWVILDEFVLINGSDILWRNIQFVNSKTE